MKHFIKQDFYFYGITVAILLVTTFVFKSSVISMIVAILGFSGSLLNGKMIRCGLLVLATNTLLYGMISFTNQFYGEAILNIVYMCPLFLFGFVRWKQQVTTTSKIRSLSKRDWLGIMILGIFVTIIYGFILRFFKTNYPFLNSLATYTCAIAGSLAARKIKQQWNFWFLYNFVLIILWFTTMQSGLQQLPFFLLNIAFLGADYLGYRNWNQQYRQEKAKSLSN